MHIDFISKQIVLKARLTYEHKIEIVFDWFDYEHLDADDCFESFKNYYVDNQSLFTAERKKLIWETADTIASSFSGKNKAELIMLAKIKLLFEK